MVGEPSNLNEHSLVCSGFAYEQCDQLAIGQLFFGYSDRRWEARLVCPSHFLAISANLDGLIDPPVMLELHSFESIGPSWTRERPRRRH